MGYIRGPGAGAAAMVVSGSRPRQRNPEARSGLDRRRHLEERVQVAEQAVADHQRTLYKVSCNGYC